MDPIYVTGHRNPDTDSIVGAMAYAALQNAMGNREYRAAALGRVSDETQTVLDRFGFEPPMVIRSMHTQVQDLDYDTPPILSKDVTVGKAWETLNQQEFIRSLPIANEDGTLYGMLSREDVDGVLVTSTATEHREILIAAAEHKKHIFTEKVLSFTLEDALAIRDAAGCTIIP